jgi:pimeloyl-ACP methyl ester carboxylesterase
MLSWITEFLSVDGAALRLLRAASNSSAHSRPAILFVHGFTDNAIYFSRAAAALAENHDVFAYDARGHGRSSRFIKETSGRGFDDELRASDLLRVLDAFGASGMGQPIAVGHSMGGSTIANAAAMRPEAFRALVLEDPAWWEASDIPAAERDAAAKSLHDRTADWRKWLLALQTADDAASLAMAQAGNASWSLEDATLSRNARREFDPVLFDHYPPPDAPWRKSVSAWRCPALLLLGSERNAIIKPPRADEACALNSRVRWVQIAGAGHSIRFDRFDEYMSAVTQFLAQV